MSAVLSPGESWLVVIGIAVLSADLVRRAVNLAWLGDDEKEDDDDQG